MGVLGFHFLDVLCRSSDVNMQSTKIRKELDQDRQHIPCAISRAVSGERTIQSFQYRATAES